MDKKKFYITTAIDYVNSLPHLGTAYEKIAADVIARYARKRGYDTFFLMGSDEHSLNVERQAKAQGLSPIDYCDKMVKEFKKVWKALDISNDDFIRTSEDRHKKAVQDILNRIHKKGDIYKGWYKGWYCESCEAFLKEGDLVNENCPVHLKKPKWVEEENYFFRLSKYQDILLKHIESNPQFIRPESRRNEILNVIKNGLEDISITRGSVGWGINVPFDKNQVIYVWFDALINYLSGIGYPEKEYLKYWQCDVHLIGKDITRFHCIIWPAMLLGADIDLPKGIYGHGFVYLGDDKMSKTKGTAVDPLKMIEEYGSDPVRYFLMREIPMERDGQFTWEKFKNRYQSDLANDLGNLLHRVLSMAKKYDDGILYKIVDEADPISVDLINTAKKTIEQYKIEMQELHLSQALISVWTLINRTNKYIEETTPWKLYKRGETNKLRSVLHRILDNIRLVALMIEPFMPKTTLKIWEQIGSPHDINIIKEEELFVLDRIPDGHILGEASPLYPKLYED